MSKNLDTLRLWFEDYSEDKLRSLTGSRSIEYLGHYIKQFQKIGVDLTAARVMEIGCGEGRVTQQLARSFPRSQFIAIDFSLNNIRLAKEQYPAVNVEYQLADVADEGWQPEGRYDLIFSFSLIQYFDQLAYKKLQKKLVAALKDDGKVLHMSIPDKDYFWVSMIGGGMGAPIKLALRWPFLLRDYLTNRYANGFWWDKRIIRRLSPTESVEILPADSFYRFDLVEWRDAILASGAATVWLTEKNEN